MTITHDEVRVLLERVLQLDGFAVASSIVHIEGRADKLMYVANDRLPAMRDRALILLGESAHIILADGIQRAATELRGAFQALQTARMAMSDAMTRLGEAVDTAVTEMGKAAESIRAHPAAQNDTGLLAMADRLSNAATALSGVDTTPIVSAVQAVDSSGTVANGGTVGG